MTYTPTKPDPGPSPRLDASNIRNNFASFATALAVNHIAMNADKQGFHEDVVLNKQAVDPEIVGNEAIVFCKDATSKLGTQPQLFVKVPKFLPTKTDTTNAPNSPMQATYNTVDTAGIVNPGYTIYQSFLWGGYLFFFGFSTDITTPIVLTPDTTELLIAIAAPNDMKTVSLFSSYDVSTVILGSNSFRIISSLNGSGPILPYRFGFYAIGKV